MTTPPQRLVAALDLGSTKVVAVIAEVTGDAREPGAKILGLGVERSGGIRRGVVRDIEETTRAIERAMKSAQRMAGRGSGLDLLRSGRRARGWAAPPTAWCQSPAMRSEPAMSPGSTIWRAASASAAIMSCCTRSLKII